MDEIHIHQCSHIGVSGTTPVHTRKIGDAWEARCGIAIMGATNMDEHEYARCNNNPFHEEFFDNFAEGKGKTEQEALDALKADMNSMAEGLW